MSVTILTPEKPSIPISVILLYICPGFRIIEKMPIAKQAHDGKIWAENNVTGKGATFILIYPLLCGSTPNEKFLQPGETLSQPIITYIGSHSRLSRSLSCISGRH